MNRKIFDWLIIGSVILNLAIWGLWWWKVKSDPNPFIYATGILVVNLALASILWYKQTLSSLYILGITIFTQGLTFVFLCFLWSGGIR